MSKRKTQSLAGVTYTQEEIAQLIIIREGYQIEVSKLNSHPEGRIGFTAFDAPAIISDGEDDDEFFQE
jgi:hypothetical protein